MPPRQQFSHHASEIVPSQISYSANQFRFSSSSSTPTYNYRSPKPHETTSAKHNMSRHMQQPFQCFSTAIQILDISGAKKLQLQNGRSSAEMNGTFWENIHVRSLQNALKCIDNPNHRLMHVLRGPTHFSLQLLSPAHRSWIDYMCPRCRTTIAICIVITVPPHVPRIAFSLLIARECPYRQLRSDE